MGKKVKGEEWLIKERHKTMLTQSKPLIKIPVLSQFRKILDGVPVPLDKNAPYFPSLDTEACNKAVAVYFKKAGLKGYGAKYLRRHLAEMALDLGQSETWIQQALGHCSDSEQTKKYMRVRGETMVGVFEKIANQG